MGRIFVLTLKHRASSSGYWEIMIGGLEGLSIPEKNDFHAAFPPFVTSSTNTEEGALVWAKIPQIGSFPPIDKVQAILNQLTGGYDTVCTSTSSIDGNERELIWTLTRN